MDCLVASFLAEAVILRERGVSSTLRLFVSITNTSEYWGARLRGCEGYGPHPEELAQQASRRMDAKQGHAAILRDARGRAPQSVRMICHSGYAVILSH